LNRNLDRGTSKKDLNVSTPNYVYLKIMKLIHRLEVPNDQKNEKIAQKTKILLKNVLTVLDEEGHKLNDAAKLKYSAYKLKTKERIIQLEESAKSKFPKTTGFFNKFFCRKKDRSAPKKFKGKSKFD
jgi:hypothetical protein